MIDATAEARVKAALPLQQLLGSDLSDQFMRHVTLARIPAGRDMMAKTRQEVFGRA